MLAKEKELFQVNRGVTFPHLVKGALAGGRYSVFHGEMSEDHCESLFTTGLIAIFRFYTGHTRRWVKGLQVFFCLVLGRKALLFAMIDSDVGCRRDTVMLFVVELTSALQTALVLCRSLFMAEINVTCRTRVPFKITGATLRVWNRWISILLAFQVGLELANLSFKVVKECCSFLFGWSLWPTDGKLIIFRRVRNNGRIWGAHVAQVTSIESNRWRTVDTDHVLLPVHDFFVFIDSALHALNRRLYLHRGQSRDRALTPLSDIPILWNC